MLKQCIFAILFRKFFCKFSKILRRPWGSAPGPPTSPAKTLNPPPRNFFLRTPLLEIDALCILIFVCTSYLFREYSIFSRFEAFLASIKSKRPTHFRECFKILKLLYFYTQCFATQDDIGDVFPDFEGKFRRHGAELKKNRKNSPSKLYNIKFLFTSFAKKPS